MPFCSLTLNAKKPSKFAQNPKTLGDHIKRRRLELSLFQRDVAKLLVVDTSTVTNWEKNRTTPTLRCMPKIIEFLGYDPSGNDGCTLGRRLLRYRKCRGMTQKELARQVGIDPTTLSRLERNQGRSFATVIQRVFVFLNTHSSIDEKSEK